MQIDIISDVICPWCFIGKKRFEAALAARPDVKPEVRWHPFELNPDLPAQGADRQEYMALKFGGPERAKEVYEPVVTAAKSLGLDIDFDAIERVPNTVKAHCLIHWADEAGWQDQMVDLLFEAYFVRLLDIGDDEVLVSLAGEAGLDQDEVRRKLAAGDDLNLIRTRARKVREQGVSGVPCFVFEQRYPLAGAQEPDVFHRLFGQLAEQGA
jgi:predicted DsbA family dithiol-disulfide isomerase